MKKVVQRIQELGRKAEQIKAAVQSVPPKVMEIRDAVGQTAGQLRQLRSEIQSTFTGLRINDDERLALTTKEIQQHTDVLLRAGFHLSGIDLDLGIARRIIVHLEKVEDVPGAVLRALVSAHQGRETLQSLLAAVTQAEDLVRQAGMENMTFHKLIVEIGLAPSVRICWRSDSVVIESEEEPISPSPASAPPPPLPAPGAASPFGHGSFFERRVIPAAPPSPSRLTEQSTKPVGLNPDDQPKAAATNPSQPGLATTTAGTDSDWRKSALDRFKKMPDWSRK